METNEMNIFSLVITYASLVSIEFEVFKLAPIFSQARVDLRLGKESIVF